jgi:hypothetical protein
MMTLNKKQAGLALGSLAALYHLLWVLAVALGYGQALLDWAYSMHFIDSAQFVGTANFATAIIGIIKAFVCGFITGWLFAWFWNKFAK